MTGFGAFCQYYGLQEMRRYMGGRWRRILMLSLVLFSLTGCKSTEDTERQEKRNIRIGVVTKSGNSEYWLSVCAGVKDAADKLGVEAVILSPDSETQKDIQKNMILDLLKSDVQAIAVSPVDSSDIREYMEEAGKKGIPVYACDTPLECDGIPYIGIDNEKMGYDLAKALAEAMGHKGHLGVISGDLAQASHRLRVEGFKKYMEQEPDMTIEMVESGYSNLRVSQSDVEKILDKYPDLEGIMTTSAVTALGLAEATEGTGIRIVSVDTQEDALDAVKEGKITALGAQYGYEIGYETVDYIVKDLKGEGTGKDRIIDSLVLTEANIEEYEDAS